MHKNQFSPLSAIWICNLILCITYIVGGPSLSFLKSSVLEYNTVSSDPFDGAVSPIAYIPDWSKSENMNKARLFESFSISDFIDIPEYDSELLGDSLQKTTSASILRYTYPVVYMGSYRGNHTEYDGSHGAVDIRAPIGTPVMSIANGVVVKVKNIESGDGKYVVIRHDGVNIGGQKETLYSGYQHLSEVLAIEGTKIKRGEVLGKVGMTGITTTPHLHFQIDKSTSPFHMYWPYTFREASDLGLDFFGAINVGLGKENTIRYTVHPMEFIKNNPFLGAWPKEISTSLEVKQEPLVASSEVVADIRTPDTTIAPEVVIATGEVITPVETPIVTPPQTVQEPKIETIVAPVEVPTTQTPALVSTSEQVFSDVPLNSPVYAATKYLRDAGVAHGYKDGGFHPSDRISRSETILLYDRLFKNGSSDTFAELPFLDILPSDEIGQALMRAFAKKIVIANTYFRPNDSLTRAEAITLLVRTSGIPLVQDSLLFRDVKSNNTHEVYINTFGKYLGISRGNFEPNKDITRGELAKILYTFDQKQKKESR